MKNLMRAFWFITFLIKLIGPKPLRIKFDKIDAFIKIYDGTRYLTFSGSETYGVIYNRPRYLISLKMSITYIFFSPLCDNQNWFLRLFALA